MRARSWGWRPRVHPLEPVWAVVRGDRCAGVLARLEGSVHAVAGPGWLALRTVSLPWVDGVVYLGRDPAEGSCFWSTNLTPDVPADWVARGLRVGQGLVPPLLIWPGAVVSVAEARDWTPAELLQVVGA